MVLRVSISLMEISDAVRFDVEMSLEISEAVRLDMLLLLE